MRSDTVEYRIYDTLGRHAYPRKGLKAALKFDEHGWYFIKFVNGVARHSYRSEQGVWELMPTS